MNVQGLFYTEAGTLRAFWRSGAFLAACLVGIVLASSLTAPIFETIFHAAGIRGDATEYWGDMLGILAATAFMLKVIEKRSWRNIWLDESAARPALLCTGLIVGALAIGVPTLALIGGHWLRVGAGDAGSWWATAVRLTVTLLPAALAEELLTRGYLLSALQEAWGWSWAVAATSLGFGLLHLKNPDASARSLSLVILAGLFLGSVVYATRSVYAAWMAHFAWNWTMAVVFHVAVSGIAMESPRYRYVDSGPSWATGGQWGPEGGLPAGAGMLGGMGLMVFVKRRGKLSRLVNS